MLFVVRIQLLLLVFASGVAGLSGKAAYVYPVVAAAAIFPIFLVAFVFSVRGGSVRVSRGGYHAGRAAKYFGMSFFLLSIVSVVRGVGAEDIDISKTSILFFIVVFAAVLVAFYSAFWKGAAMPPDAFLHGVMLSLAVFCVANFILWIVGVESPYKMGSTIVEDSASLLGFFGFNFNRVFFPMAPGVNAYGVAMGALLIYGVMRFPEYWRVGWRKTFFWLIVFFATPLLTLLLLDSRGALMSVFLAYLITRWLRSFPVLVIFLSIAMPVALVFYGGGEWAGAARDASTSGLLSGREFIWAPVVASIMNFDFGSFFGYGVYGQAVSGVSRYYSSAFSGWVANEDMISVHNAYLQVIMDIGLIGFSLFFIFFVLFIRSINGMWRAGIVSDGVGGSVIAVMIFLVIQGMTDVTLSAVNFHAFLVLIAAFTVVLNGCDSSGSVLGERVGARNLRL